MTQEMLDKINQANAFMHHNHIRVVRQERDQAAVSLELCPDSLNPFGMLHGAPILRWRTAPAVRRPEATGGGM